jgi:hypothetical protein
MARMGYYGAVALDQESDFRKGPGRTAVFIRIAFSLVLIAFF